MEAICWACSARIDSEDNFCRRCGKGQGAHVAWYYQHWGIVVCTLLGLGPFGLILVWRSPVVGQRARWVYTAAIVLLTWYVGLRLYQAMLMLQAAVNSALQTLPL